jgi:hypothetical protein
MPFLLRTRRLKQLIHDLVDRPEQTGGAFRPRHIVAVKIAAVRRSFKRFSRHDAKCPALRIAPTHSVIDHS